MIFVMRQIQEKCREQIVGLYAALIDLLKAFNTVSHDGYGISCSDKDVCQIICQWHQGQKGQVKHGDTLSETFPVSNRVKQGFILAQTLFTIFLSMMPREAKENIKGRICINF